MKKGLILVYTAVFLLLSFGFYSCSNEENEPTNSNENEGLFTLLYPTKTNINFQNALTEGLNTNILMYEYFYNGGGVATADFNGDGMEDIYFTANLSENKLYLNNGDFHFQDITNISQAGGRPGPWKTGVSVVDINSDGKLDLYLCYSGSLPPQKRVNELFVNQGNNENGIPVFKESAAEYGLNSSGFSNQSYFFDADRDGDLDMLLLNHNPKNLPILNEASTREFMAKDDPEMGLRFFKNNNGYYTDETLKSGINGSALSYGLGLGISDFNQDGWPDFYVSNDYSVPDYYYINQKNGKFKNELANSICHISQFSMGNDVADINNDGLTDIFTLDMLPEDNRRQKLLLAPDNFNKFELNVRSGFYYQYMRNMLQLNNGNGTFSEIGQLAGVSNTDWSWSALLADYDNDGWKDLFVSNGYYRDYTNLDFIKYMDDFVKEKGRLNRDDVLGIISHMPSSNVGNYIFQNQKGASFLNKTKDWGLSETSNSNGAAYADLDNDGDLDLVVNNINKAAFVFRNNTENNYLKIKLKGSSSNTLGIGVKVLAEIAGSTTLIEQNLGRGYLSSISPILNLGLGKNALIDKLTINWPTGEQEVLKNVKVNQMIEVDIKNASKSNENNSGDLKTIFTRINSAISYTHPKLNYRDFDRQPLLIHEQSFEGPVLKKVDLNADGLEDVFIGGAAGKSAEIYFQSSGGSFSKSSQNAFQIDAKSEDTDAAFIDVNNDGAIDVLIASGGYHLFNKGDAALADRLYINNGKGQFSKSKMIFDTTPTACFAEIDINNDGLKDVFVAGGVILGRYPEHSDSYFLVNDGKGNLTKKVEKSIGTVGLIKGVLSADLDNDKNPELLLVGEWMGMKAFENTNGNWKDVSATYFDKDYKGWWNCIKLADLNYDGKLDILVGNEGLNTQFRASEKEPLSLYAKDFDNNGTIDPIFGFYIQGKTYPYVTRDELLEQLPKFKQNFISYSSFSDVGIDKIFPASELKTADYYEANYMATAVFLSTKDNKYQLAKLPMAVQYAPIHTIEVFDFDKDGQLDILFFGNNSHSKLRLGKSDANFGVFLKGNGKGQFATVSQSQSALKIWGDVRSSLFLNNTLILGINGKEIQSYKLTN
jgi:enediyne biosynthesis protein E4